MSSIFQLVSGCLGMAIISWKRCLDMEKGVTVREVCWKSPSGKTVKINVTRMASFKILPLFLIEYRVEAVDFSGEVRIVSAHNGDVRNYFDPKDPRVAGESFQHLYIESVDQEEGVSFVTSVTSKSGLKVTSAVNNRLELFDKDGNDRIVNRSTTQSDSGVVEEFTAAMSEDETLVLYKYTILCDSIRCADVKEEAAGWMQQALAMNVAELYHDQETYLGRFWTDCSVEVQGDKELNEAINYNLYQLIQSAAKDPYCNIAAKGLSGEGYEGHYFWDTEMYLQPFFILNAREISKNLIRNRYSILEYAKENAKLLGHKKGAAFPWLTEAAECIFEGNKRQA